MHGAWCMVHGTSKGNQCRSLVHINYLTLRSFEFVLFMARGRKTGGWFMVYSAWCMVHCTSKAIGTGARCTLNYLTIRTFEVELFMARGGKTGNSKTGG